MGRQKSNRKGQISGVGTRQAIAEIMRNLFPNETGS